VESRRTSGGGTLNPFMPGHGRDITKPAATEHFRGCSFNYVVAYADVLAQTEVFRSASRAALSAHDRPPPHLAIGATHGSAVVEQAGGEVAVVPWMASETPTG
jgi:hypothetical protein